MIFTVSSGDDDVVGLHVAWTKPLVVHVVQAFRPCVRIRTASSKVLGLDLHRDPSTSSILGTDE